MVEVSTISFEIQNVEKFFPVFYKNITQEGYSDLHGSLLTHAARLLHDSMKVDFNDVIDTSSKNTGIKILVNQEMKTSVLLESGLRRGRRHEQVMYEISIFSDDIKKNIKGIDFIKDILINKIKIKSVIIDGSQKEFLMHNILGTLKENHRSRLIEQVSDDMIKPFMNEDTRNILKQMALTEYKFIPSFLTSEIKDIDTLVNVNILKESYNANCKKCPELYASHITSFETKEALSKNLEEEVMLCPQCGVTLNTDNATIDSVYSFTDVGQECAKGLWLEAYISILLKENGITQNNIKCCHFHDKDELDHVFIVSSNLIVSETKDRNIGQNDIYVTAMKATRINADKIFLISTEELSKDVLPQTRNKEKPIYIPITGSTKEISKKLKTEIIKMRKEYVNEKLNVIKEILSRVELGKSHFRTWTIRP